MFFNSYPTRSERYALFKDRTPKEKNLLRRSNLDIPLSDYSAVTSSEVLFRKKEHTLSPLLWIAPKIEYSKTSWKGSTCRRILEAN